MNIKIFFATLVFLLIVSLSESDAQTREKCSPARAEMTNTQMLSLFEEYMDKVEGTEGSWQLLFSDRPIFVLSDSTNNRMRIFSPIIEEKDLRRGELSLMLEANFHTALDAKYSMYEGFVISIFTHPLRELTEDQLLSAIGQVFNLAETFGTTYSSTSLEFGAPSKSGTTRYSREIHEKKS